MVCSNKAKQSIWPKIEIKKKNKNKKQAHEEIKIVNLYKYKTIVFNILSVKYHVVYHDDDEIDWLIIAISHEKIN